MIAESIEMSRRPEDVFSYARGSGRIPVVAMAKGTIKPLAGGQRSLVTIALEFDGHGIGRLLATLIRHQSRKQLPEDGKRPKELLEHGR